MLTKLLGAKISWLNVCSCSRLKMAQAASVLSFAPKVSLEQLGRAIQQGDRLMLKSLCFDRAWVQVGAHHTCTAGSASICQHL